LDDITVITPFHDNDTTQFYWRTHAINYQN
jgi:hypothetical protein